MISATAYFKDKPHIATLMQCPLPVTHVWAHVDHDMEFLESWAALGRLATRSFSQLGLRLNPEHLAEDSDASSTAASLCPALRVIFGK